MSDGWNIAYAALRLHRLSLATGEHLDDVRTRHQSVSALLTHGGHLYAATDSRLFELRVWHLAVLRQWDKRLVRFAMQLVPEQSVLVAANWLTPSIGLFDLEPGRTRRLKVGIQPLVFRLGGEVRVIAGFEGGMWTLDVDGGRLTNHQETPPVANVTAGQHIWATLAGRREGGQGEPPVWTKRGTQVITRLTGTAWTARATGPVTRLICDERRGVLWCLVGDGSMQLQAVSLATGAVLSTFVPPPGRGVGFCHVDPTAGVALCCVEPHHVTRGNYVLSSTSALVCYSLPDFHA